MENCGLSNDLMVNLLHLSNLPFLTNRRSWQKIGVIIKVSKEKITKSEQVDSYIVSCNKMGNLDGIFLVATSPDSNAETELVSLIECLDEKSKKLSPSLK